MATKTSLFTFLVTFGAASFAFAGAAVTYHGRILDANDNPVETSHVVFKIQVRSPGTPNCLLYEESRTVDMHASSGVFVIPIGDGHGSRTSNDPGITIENIFSNNTALNHTSLSCNSGTSYQPIALDSRRLVVTFNDGSGSGDQVLPEMDVNYVPFSLHAFEAASALKIGATPASQVMSVAAGAVTPLSAANFTELLLLVNGNSSGYVKPSSVPSCASGEVLKGTGGAFVCVTDTGGTDTLAGITCPDGKILKRSAGAWACGDESGVGTENDPTVAAFAKRAPGTGLVVNGSNDLTVDFGTAAGKVAQGNDSRFTDSRAPNGSATGDLAGSYPNPSVKAIRGNAIATTTPLNGQVYQWVNGSTEWQPKYLSFADLKKSDGTTQMPATCAANQTLAWSAITDVFSCADVGSLDASKITTGTIAYARLPVGTAANTLAAGDDSRFGNALKVVGTGINISSLTSGQVLKYDGTNWVNAADSGVGSEVDPSVQAYAKNAPATGLIVNGSNKIAPDFGVTAGKVVEGNDARLSDTRVASDLNSVVSTGIVQRTGAGAFSTLGVSAPVTNSGTNIGLAVGAGLTLNTGSLVPDFGTASGKVAQGNDSRFPSSTCASGNKMRWDGSAWACETDNVTDTTKVAKGGDTMTGTLNLPANGLTIGTTQFAMSGGNVGIGTASPQYPIDIQHTGNFAFRAQGKTAANQTSFYFENDRGGFTSYGGLLYGGSASTLGNLFGQPRTDRLFMFSDGASNLGFYTGTLTAQPYVIGTNNVERMRIDSSGNVGVGTASPGSPLTANGIIESTAGGFKFPDGSIQSSAAGTGSSTWVVFNTAGTILQSSNVASVVKNTTGDYTITFSTPFPNANYAVTGTSELATTNTFNSWVSVEKNGKATGSCRVRTGNSATGAQDASTVTVVFGSVAATASSPWTTAGSTVSYTSGNVGIGTTTPTYNLEVQSGDGASILRLRGSGDTADFSGLILRSEEATPKSWLMSQRNSAGNVNDLLFAYNNGSTWSNRMIVTSAGNVGIGTTSPADALEVAGGIRAGGADGTSGSSFRTAGGVIYTSRNTTVAASHHIFYNPNGVVGSINTTNSSTQYNTTSDIRLKENFRPVQHPMETIRNIQVLNYDYKADPTKARIDGFIAQQLQPLIPYAVTVPEYDIDRDGRMNPWQVDYSKVIPLLTAGLQEIDQTTLKIGSNGNVGIGTTSPGYKLDVQGGGVNASGGYTQTSDIRLKTNVEYLNSHEALDKITTLHGIYYDWKDQAQFGKDHQVGLVAQDVQKVYPEAVKTNSEGFLSVSYSNLVAPVIEAIKELLKVSDGHSRDIASVKAENAAKDQEIAQLKTRADKAEADAAKQKQESEAKIKALEERFERLEKSLNSK